MYMVALCFVFIWLYFQFPWIYTISCPYHSGLLPQCQRSNTPDIKVHGANMGPIWGRQDPGGPLVGPMNFVIWGRILTRLNTTKPQQSITIHDRVNRANDFGSPLYVAFCQFPLIYESSTVLFFFYQRRKASYQQWRSSRTSGKWCIQSSRNNLWTKQTNATTTTTKITKPCDYFMENDVGW